MCQGDRFNSRDMEMIYRSNESGKPVLFARPDQQRSRPAFWIVNDRPQSIGSKLGCVEHQPAVYRFNSRTTETICASDERPRFVLFVYTSRQRTSPPFPKG